MPTREPRFQSIASHLLAYVSVGFGLYAAIYAIQTVYLVRSPVPYLDQWNSILELVNSGGQLSLSWLWMQHHEHRIPFGRLAIYTDMFLFGGKSISLFLEILLIQISETALLAWMLFRYGRLARSASLTAAGFFCFCMFFPIQMDNFGWAFQVSYLLNVFASTLALAATVAHSRVLTASGGKLWFSLALLVSFAAGIVAEFTLVNGVLIWPMIWLTGFALSFPRKTQWLIAAVGIWADLAYLIGYHKSAGPVTMTGVPSPWRVFQYVRTYFAFSWDARVPSSTAWPNASEVLTGVAIAVVLAAAGLLLCKRSATRPIQTFFILNCVFMVGTAVVTSFGRLSRGVAQATASRYQTDALLFWACFAGLVLLWLASDSAKGRQLLVFQAALLALMASGIHRFDVGTPAASQRRIRSAEAYLSLADGDLAKARYLHPRVDLAKGFAFLKANHIGPDLDELRATVPQHRAGSIAPIDGSEQPKLQGYQVAIGRCLGFMESANPAPSTPNGMVLTGWAWSLPTSGKATGVMIALEDGTVLGRVALTVARPDVPQAIPSVKDQRTGWNIELPIPPHAKVRAFLDLMSENKACPLAQQFVQP